MKTPTQLLQTLLNLHDGIDDGGAGITPDDWMEVRALLDGGETSSARHYVVTLDLDLGGHLKTAKHLVCAFSEAAAEELAIRAESHDREDNTPPDEDDRYEDGLFLYAVDSVTPVAPEHVAILKLYL